MDHIQEGGGAEEWLLTSAERGNPATDLDQGPTDGAAWARGNLVRPLIDGAEYFHRLMNELADTRAGDQIYFAAWIGDPNERLDESGPSIGPLLARALDAGVHVIGLFWCPYLDPRKDFVPDNHSFIALLQSRGGSAALDQRVRAVGSHHQKFLVIRRPERPDTDIAFIGGIDPCPSRLDDHDHRGDHQVQSSIAEVYGKRPAWHDAHLEVRGPAVTDVEHCFRERWNDAAALRRVPFRWRNRKSQTRTRDLPELPEPLPTPPQCGPHTVQLLRTYPCKTPPYPFAPRGERSVARGYAKALHKARQLVYVEDQFLWSPMVAEVFADALRCQPNLRMVAVLPSRPDKDGPVHVATSDIAHRKALDLLHAAGGDRVDVYELENTQRLPIYVHSKACIVDDVWATVGSANLNRRSWTYDSELTVAVVDGSQSTADGTHGFAMHLRRRLWREHLGRNKHEDADLVDFEQGIAVLRHAAATLDRWHNTDQTEPRPPGHLRVHPRPTTSSATRAWATPTARTLIDPDGRPLSLRLRGLL
jgi:phosphatidylserine/phosphatidylglycerophosphate/cardiolipin synthase-like enzyme